jgi:tRNA pseudouridine38-40 synthase
MDAAWKQTDQLLVFHITADRFLRNMVRAIVGTLIEIGKGKMTLEEFKQIIESENRSNAGPSAPAHGLFLTQVAYPKTIFNNEQ